MGTNYLVVAVAKYSEVVAIISYRSTIKWQGRENKIAWGGK